MTRIYHNQRCSKSRQTLSLLSEKSNDFEVVDYLKNPPSFEELRSIIGKLGINPFDLIRKGEAIYNEKYRSKNLTDDEWIEVMVSNHPDRTSNCC